MEVRKIAAAACRLNGVIYTLKPPARHHTILHWMYDQGLASIRCNGENQGFIDQDKKRSGKNCTWQRTGD